MADGKNCDHKTETTDAEDKLGSEALILFLDDSGVPTNQEQAKCGLVFSDEATIKLLTQDRDEKVEVRLWRLGMCHAGVTVWEWDLKTREIKIDELAEGPPLCYGSLEGNTWEEIAHEDDRKRVLEAVQRFEETGYVSFDCSFRLATEIPRWVHVRDTQLLLDANEEPMQVIGIFIDVTESQIAKDHVYWGKELPENESENVNWLRLMSEIDRHDMDGDRINEIKYRSGESFDALMIFSHIPAYRKNTDLAYVEVNEPFERLVGLSSQEILKRGDEELWGKEASEYLTRLRTSALNGESVQHDHVRRINGEPCKFFDEVYPEWDFTGRISGVRGITLCIGPVVIPEQTEDRPDRQRISVDMRSLYQKIRLATQSNCLVLLTGESGSGKNYFARRIHELSSRGQEPFEILNCAALPKDLAESELFGHEPGAFTGARGRKRGLLEIAVSGTVVLDEIGEMALELQAKLLTFLDTRCFKRLGGEKDIQCKARIIATTNVDLKQAVAEGRFRKDLYYRINVFHIQIPPVRQRPEEIPSIVRGLMMSLTRALELERIPQIDGFAMKKLLSYDWPGNVRELRNVLERAITHANGPQIGAGHIIFDSEEETSPEDVLQGGDISIESGECNLNAADRSKYPVPLRNPSDEQIRALHEEYIVRRGASSTDIAKQCGVTDSAVRWWFKRAGLTKRRAGRPKKKRAG